MRIWGEDEALDYQEFPWEHIVVKHWESNSKNKEQNRKPNINFQDHPNDPHIYKVPHFGK